MIHLSAMSCDTYDAYTDLLWASYLFNELSGGAKELSEEAVVSQYDLIKEEFNELTAAMQAKDTEEVLDGCIDILVTTYGLLQKLEALGCNVEQAMIDTANNNASKFPYADQGPNVLATVAMYAEQGIKVQGTFNDEYQRYVIRDTNGKVRKPLGYVSNDLSKHTEGVKLGK